ncbi:MAG: hypothetical protein MSA49_00175 [Clostridia bacterium]|nr:hypothetical protein [Clostridia bacterium]
MPSFSNQATLSYNGNVALSNIVTGEIVEVLTATKNALRPTYTPDDTVTYVINIINSGTTAIAGVTLSDNLGAYPIANQTVVPLNYVPGSLKFYVNGVLQPTPSITAGPPLTVTGLTIPAGANAALVYEATVNTLAPPTVGGSVTNTATVTGGGLTAPITAAETINSTAAPILSIGKSVSPATVSENGQLTYTFQIQNRGNTAAAATDNVVVTDNFNPILNPITVTLNGQALTAGTDYTYDATTGAFATVPGRITVPAATYAQNTTTGAFTIAPGSAVLTVTGTV